MKHCAPLIGAMLCILLLGAVNVSAQTAKGVASSGGVSAMQGETHLVGTIGQSTIGVVRTLSTEAMIGFWHAQTAKTSSAFAGNDGSHAVNTLQLSSNPNPFSKSTTLSFSVPSQGLVSLIIYNSIGQPVRTLLNNEMEAGPTSTLVDLHELPSGNYTAVLRAGGTQATTALRLID